MECGGRKEQTSWLLTVIRTKKGPYLTRMQDCKPCEGRRYPEPQLVSEPRVADDVGAVFPACEFDSLERDLDSKTKLSAVQRNGT